MQGQNQQGNGTNGLPQPTAILDLIERFEIDVARTDLSEIAPINQFPDLVLIKILRLCDKNWFSMFNPKGRDILCSVRLVCKKWYLLCRDRAIWQSRGIHCRDIRSPNLLTNQRLLNFLVYAPYAGRLDLNIASGDHLTKEGILHALQFARRTKALYFPQSIALDVDTVAKIVQLCPRLELFEPIIFDYDSAPEICRLLANLTHLEKLCLCRVTNMEEEIGISIIRNCSKITHLDLGSGVTGKTIRTIVECLPNMEYLSLHGVADVTCHDIGQLSCLTGLTVLHLRRVDVPLDTPCIAAITFGCRNLRDLEISFSCFDDGGSLIAIAYNLRYLVRIDLSYTNVADAEMCVLGKNCKSLMEVYIPGCRDVTELGIWCLTVGLEYSLINVAMPFRFQYLLEVLKLRFPTLYATAVHM